MSVQLLIDGPDDRGRSVPVASEQVFSRYWTPLSDGMGCVWIPMFQTGLPIDGEDRSEVILELQRFSAEAQSRLPEDAAWGGVAVRAQGLVEALQGLRLDEGESAYIG